MSEEKKIQDLASSVEQEKGFIAPSEGAKVKHPFNWLRLALTIFFILFASGIAAMGTWYAMGQQVKADNEKNEKEKQELRDTITESKKYIEDSNKELQELQDQIDKLNQQKEDPVTAGPDKIVDLFMNAKQKMNYTEAKKYVTNNVYEYFGSEEAFKAEITFPGMTGYTVKEAGIYPSKTSYRLTVTERVASSNPETGETFYYTLDIPMTLVQTTTGWKIDAFEVPMGMGKPVIYLYPKNTTKVHVTVEPDGGFSYTDPVYKNGWDVLAKPDGSLFVGGKKYPYLFWEGASYKVNLPKTGFMVKRENLSRFMDQKLAILGLNEKEAREFKEFWLPRMQEKPYYFVNFIPQKEIDRIAPLKISPQPDTTIRVLMYYKSSDHSYPVIPQLLMPVARRGFSVIEWGGIFSN